MLAPDDRRLLLESLRPPEGFQLDFAIATTFSLDLVALLTAPVAFTFHDWENEDGRPVADPLALLESLSRHADKLAVFCQADRIVAPAKAHQLFTFLERRIVPVRARHPDGLFHPKVWAIRYAAADGDVRYRLLVSSRNLTFDRSWDTLLVLEGPVEDRKVGFGHLRPLGEFFDALPGLGVHHVPEDIANRVGEMAAEIRRVRFELPEGVEEVAFWPIGLGKGSAWPFPKTARKMVVLSPFLTGDAVGRLGKIADDAILVSDAAELDRLGKSQLASFSDIRVLNPSAQQEDGETKAPGLLGLHTKLYVLDQGKTTHVWTGSANATTAGFGINVELLAELQGPRRLFGTDVLLAEGKGVTSFASLLEPYEPPDEPEVDEVEESMARLVESIRTAIGKLGLELRVSPADEPDTFALVISGSPIEIESDDAEVEITCRPISLGDAKAVRLVPGAPVTEAFTPISFEALTSFIAFQVSVRRGDRLLEERFVLNLPLHGEPAGRRQRVIQSLLSDERSVLRFILMLLAGDAELSAAALARTDGAAGEGWMFGFGDDTVLESLLRALVREPGRLDRVAQLLADLQAGENPPPLPEGFLRVWKPIWAARQGAP